ncbi:MAG TPA: polyamine aminopropyltransferase [Abditibacteriaceae bacterium]|jgi:spermidine synthase
MPEPLVASDETFSESATPSRETTQGEAAALLVSIFVIAACGLIYELLIATVSSYLLGSSVTQFSISIGVFLGAMGLGSHLSAYVTRRLLGTFIFVEILLGLAGGISTVLLFWSYAAGWLYWVALYGSLIFIGALTGLELPILTRLLKDYGALREIIARVMSFDYVGALVGSLLFPLLLLPSLGLARTAFLVGLVNIGIAAWTTWTFRARLRGAPAVLGMCALAGAFLLSGLAFSDRAMSFAERGMYEDEVIWQKQTPYQRLVVTRWREDLRLFIDGNLQFASPDEYRYHEALVHPAFALAAQKARPERVLLLGGGDGLAVREVVKYTATKKITLVDLDPEMTKLGRDFPALRELNGDALRDPRVEIVNADAYKYLETSNEFFDVIIADLPDPNGDALAKLYSVEFYRLAARRLSRGGVFVTQATSPFFARDAFWCVEQSLRAAKLQTAPYHAYVPSFGDWGFILAAPRALAPATVKLSVPTKFLTREMLREMTIFPRDSARVAAPVSTLDRPAILNLYLRGSKQWE